MAGKGRESFEKRQRERDRQRRAAEKRARREERANAEPGEDDEATDPRTPDELLEEFRVLSERHAAGAVPDDEFEARRAELYEALGMA